MSKLDETLIFECCSVNGYPYKRENGEWVPDHEAHEEQSRMEAQEQKRKDDLIWACRSRVCTEAEMEEIEQRSTNLLIRMNGGMSQNYKESELEQQLNALLLQQFRLRRVAEMEKSDVKQQT